jgi:hypothetical protein
MGAVEQPANRPLDKSFAIERICDADREAMLAALRVVLGLPRRIKEAET